MASKPKDNGRNASGLTQPGELYFPGDALPVPEVVEKNTDSVWALWSDMVDNEAEPDKEFKETQPMDFDAEAPTQLIDLPDLSKDSGPKP